MQFSFPITIPANTEITNPTRLETILCAGVLKKCSVYFPWGCGGLAHVRILHYEHQLAPVNIQQWYNGNDIYIEFRMEYPIYEGWVEFKLEGYNQDDTYPHTPIVNFVIIPFATSPTYPPTYFGG